jgi:hypothetical protein
MSQATANGTPQIVATYDYRDEEGQLLYQSLRYEPGFDGEPKTFRQRRPNGKGGWVNSIKGVRLVLYRLPELLAAVRDRLVIVVEGEKDVENLRNIGILATTNAMGAGKWRPEYNEALHARHVVILPDNDQAGRDHANAVALSLHESAASLKVVELPGLPEKGDVSDWLQVPGNDKEKLLKLVQAAPAWRPAQKEDGAKSVGSVGGKNRYRPLPAFRPFPLRSLPPVLCDLVPAAAEGIGCDPALVALPALTVAAGCIGNARAIVLKRGWIEPSVVWSLTVAESGGHKSPAYYAAVQPLTDLQMDLFEQHQQRKQDHKKELEAYADLVRELKQQRGSFKGLVKPPAPEEPPVHVTTDSTIEALGVLLGDNPHGLLLARDELDGWFQSFTRYKGKGGTDRPQWLELHKAGTLILHRLTREQRCLSVRRAAVSITGTIQPSVLAGALDRDALQAGLGARFLLAMPPRRPRVWTEADLPDQLAADYRRLLLDLLGLPLADTAKRKPYYLGLSDAARRLWIEFYNEWGQVQHDAEGEQASAFAKIEAYSARLMLLHHVITEMVVGGPRTPPGDGRNLPPLTEASARAGIELARWFAAEALRVYAMLHETQEERETRKLVEWIAAHGGRVTVRQLQRSNSRKWPSGELAEIALQVLVDAGLGRWELGPVPTRGPAAHYFVLALPVSDWFSSDRFPDQGNNPQRNDKAAHTRTRHDGSCGDAAGGVPGGANADENQSEENLSDGHGDSWEG